MEKDPWYCPYEKPRDDLINKSDKNKLANIFIIAIESLNANFAEIMKQRVKG